jgi:3-oxoacyl-[acyl-carrier protein] reductase
MTKRLEGRSAVITAAGSGIGRASALAFAREGARLVINDLREDALDETLEAIRADGGSALAVPGDVTTREVNDRLVATAVDEYGRLDCIDLVAGGDQPKGMLERDDDDFRRVIALNLDSAYLGARAALRVMVPQRSGSIIGTSSGAGIGAVLGLAEYGAAKAGVAALMRGIAREFGGRGIRANTISPGPMATPGLMTALDRLPGGADAFAAQIPLGRLGTAEEIAAVAVFLASDEARYVSGVHLPVDGAIHSSLATPDPMAAD